ncbi:hypothetical protein BJX64DRAFT_268828 [Aspergillus heterothallicus]
MIAWWLPKRHSIGNPSECSAGAVVPILKRISEDEGIRRPNNSDYGLGVLWTKDTELAVRGLKGKRKGRQTEFGWHCSCW